MPDGFNVTDSKNNSKQYFVFWDMDDTSYHFTYQKIKNPHLLLPILLFQCHAENQHFGICTNRTPTEEEVEYKVSDYLAVLRECGIHISEKHVVFGGGRNMTPQNLAHGALESAFQTINEQVGALTFSDAAEPLRKQLDQFKTQLIEARISGKNFIINDFLNDKFDSSQQHFQFETGTCAGEDLIVGIVDDCDTISSKISLLGGQCFGIKASRGGKPDFKVNEGEVDDYHSDAYLIELAQKIGLHQLAEDLLMSSDGIPNSPKHTMIHIAAMLYAWHASPMKESIEIEVLVNMIGTLSADQIKNIINILDHTIGYKDHTTDEHHYNRVEELRQSIAAKHELACLQEVILEPEPLETSSKDEGELNHKNNAPIPKKKESFFSRIFIRNRANSDSSTTTGARIKPKKETSNGDSKTHRSCDFCCQTVLDMGDQRNKKVIFRSNTANNLFDSEEIGASSKIKRSQSMPEDENAKEKNRKPNKTKKR